MTWVNSLWPLHAGMRRCKMADYSDVAEKYLEVTLRSGNEWMARCPFHDDSSASLQFNIHKGLYICFACHASGNIKTFLRHFGAQYRDPEVDVADIYQKLDLIESVTQAPQKAAVLPESTLKRYSFPTDYWASRGLSRAVQTAFDLGYDPIENEAIIPVRNINGGLMGVIRRRLEMDYGPKYMYYKGFPRKTSMFASWLVAKKGTDHAVITEGSLDSVSVWQAGYPAMAQYGSRMSREQVVLLRRLGISKITLFYDNDKAGQEATLAAIPLLREFLIYVVQYADGDPKDPGGMDSATIKKRIDAATLIL